MDPERVELVRSLFVVMTEHAEALHECAVDGQVLHVSAIDYTDNAKRMIEAAEAICDLAKAAAILCKEDHFEAGD